MTHSWVVIPTYNERANIQALIEQLFALGDDRLTVLIVDDTSPDGTAEVVRSLQLQYPRLQLLVRAQKTGLGRAYVHGFTHALTHGATQIVQMDADFSHDPRDVLRLLAGLAEADAVIGSRYSHGISVINWPLRRLLISLIGNVYARVIMSMPFHDITGGFRAWRADVLRAIDLPTVEADGYGFQIVMTYRAWKHGFKLLEIPITFTERREGQSKMSRAIVWEAIWLVWRLRLFGK